MIVTPFRKPVILQLFKHFWPHSSELFLGPKKYNFLRITLHFFIKTYLFIQEIVVEV